MSMLQLSLLVIVVAINFILAGFSYLRNRRSATNILFALEIVIINAYLISNFWSLHATTNAEAVWLVRLVMMFAAPMSVVFFLLMHTYPRATMLMTRRTLLIWAFLTVLTMIAAISPLVFPQVELVPGSAPQPTPGPGMILFVPIAIGTIPLGLFYIIRKTIKARGRERIQMRLLLAGVTVMFLAIIAFIFIGTVIFNTSTFTQYAPIFTLPFVGLTAYSIIRYRLMDIRLALFRGLSLSFLVGGLLLVYGLLLIFAVPIITDITGVRGEIIAAIAALISIPLARYIQAVLTKITDRFLFQRRVDYPAALARLSSELSATIKIGDVTTTINQAMTNLVRARKTVIFLRKAEGREYTPRASQGVQNFHVAIPPQHSLVNYLNRTKGPLIKDELALKIEQEESPDRIRELKEVAGALNWLDAAVIVPLYVNKQLTGIIVLGDKLTGEPFSVADINFLSTFAPQAATALENARLYHESLEFTERLKAEVERATHELEVANTQLRDLDKAKSEFLSVASHQLNTPLTPLRGYLSMILEGDYGKIPPKQKPILRKLEKSAVRLVGLIKNYLDISRIESGRLELNLESVNMIEMAEGLVEDLLPNAISKNLELEFRPRHKEVPHVVADRDRLRQVILNFIDNAIKYTDEGSVTVRVFEEGTEVVVAIEDTGRGLTQSEIARLFTKFTRVGGKAKFRAEGTGLGLYVAKQIVGEHKGRVEVASEGLGQGSTFSLRLPAEGSPQSLKAGAKAAIMIKAADKDGKPDYRP